jgi:hypothetical protein
MIYSIMNLLVLVITAFAVIIFAAVFGFFLFIMFACVYFGWMHIRSMPLAEIWDRIKR